MLAPTGVLWLIGPVLAAVLAVVEVGLGLVIVGTALFGSETASERAFRLLRWVADRPEPTPPPGRRARVASSTSTTAGPNP